MLYLAHSDVNRRGHALIARGGVVAAGLARARCEFGCSFVVVHSQC